MVTEANILPNVSSCVPPKKDGQEAGGRVNNDYPFNKCIHARYCK